MSLPASLNLNWELQLKEFGVCSITLPYVNSNINDLLLLLPLVLCVEFLSYSVNPSISSNEKFVFELKGSLYLIFMLEHQRVPFQVHVHIAGKELSLMKQA